MENVCYAVVLGNEEIISQKVKIRCLKTHAIQTIDFVDFLDKLKHEVFVNFEDK